MNRLDQPAVPSDFETMRNVAYGLIFCIWALAASLPQDGFGSLWILPVAGGDILLFAMRLLVFAELAVMVYRWITATHHELIIWFIWFPQHPREKQEVYAAMFGLSIFLGLELALIPHIRLLTFVAATLALFNHWTQSLANEHFRETLESSRSLKDDDRTRRKGFNVLEKYWLERPQLTRIAAQIYFIGLAFTSAVISFYVPQPEKAWYQAAAYAILFLTILVTEIMVTIWRHCRDKVLDRLEAKLTPQMPEHA